MEVLNDNNGNELKLYENGVEILTEKIDGVNGKVFAKRI